MNALGVPAELRETVEMLKGVWADPGARKAIDPDLAKTFGISSGMQPYDLAPYAVILQPVFSPIRNRLTRQHVQGKQFEYKAVTAVNANAVNAVTTEGSVANQITTTFADVIVNHESYGLASDPVTYEQLWAGQGRVGDFNIDSRALAVANLLKALMIQEEKLILYGVGATTQIATTGGDSWTIGGLIGTPTAPSLAAGTSGSLTGTVYVKQTVVTGMGESTASAAANNAFGTASNGSLVVTPVASANKPFVKYGIYASTDNSTWYLQAYTNGAPVTITSVSTSGASYPTTDSSGSTNAFNGIFSYLFGGGTNAVLQGVNAALTDLDSTLDKLLRTMWDNSNADPDDIWVNSKEIQTISNLAVGSGQPYYLSYNSDEQANIIGRYRVSRWVNPITSKILPLNVHAYLNQGQILFLTTTLPPWYIGNNVPSVWSMTLTQDYLEIDYEPTRSYPNWQSEIRCFGGLTSYIPAVNGVLYGIS